MGTANDATWYRNGQLLASASYDSTPSHNADVHIWRTDTWERVAVLEGLKGFMHSAWHPLLPILATVGQQKGEIALWQLDLDVLLPKFLNRIS
jgi:hypothetical protein